MFEKGQNMKTNPLEALRNSLFTSQILNQDPDWETHAFKQLELGTNFLPEIVGLLRSNDAYAKEVASQSYVHSNGFGKIVLGRTKVNRCQIRLHIWPYVNSAEAGSHSDLHDHRWSFVSLPLMGEFTEIRYKVEPFADPVSNGSMMYCYKCYPRSGQERLRIERCNLVTLSVVSRSVRVPGEPYSCKSGEVHLFEPCPPGPAASLVLTGSPERPFAKVYKHTPLKRKTTTVPSPTMTIEALRQAFTILDALLLSNEEKGNKI